VATGDFHGAREAAMREVLAGYQRGLARLDPRDQDERAWFLERIRDLWTIVAAPQPHATSSPDAPR
jgi:hypothetical protein